MVRTSLHEEHLSGFIGRALGNLHASASRQLPCASPWRVTLLLVLHLLHLLLLFLLVQGAQGDLLRGRGHGAILLSRSDFLLARSRCIVRVYEATLDEVLT